MCMVHSPLFFRKIVKIERFVLQAAILHGCQNHLGHGGGLGGSNLKIKMAAVNGKTCYISTISRKNRGL